MKKIYIYEPAMCCPTGLCGPTLDPELLRMSFIMNNIQNAQVEAVRYNLTSEPQVFVEHEEINALLMAEGMSCLPATFVDGELVMKGSYPTNAQFAKWTGISEDELVKKPKVRLSLKGDV